MRITGTRMVNCDCCGWRYATAHKFKKLNFCCPSCEQDYKDGIIYIKREHKNRYIPPQLRFQILKRDNFTCQYCGRTVKDGAKLHIDHIVPHKITKNSSDINNLMTSCELCNLGKTDCILTKEQIIFFKENISSRGSEN